MSDKQSNNKPDSTIIEAEVVSESKASASDKDAKNREKRMDGKHSATYDSTAHAKKPPQSLLDRIKSAMLHFAFAIFVVLALVFLYSEQSWLQNRFATVDADLQILDQKLKRAQELASQAQSAGQEQQQSLESFSQQLEQLKGSMQSAQGVKPEALDAFKQQLQTDIEQKLASLQSISPDVSSVQSDVSDTRLKELNAKLAALQAEQLKLNQQLAEKDGSGAEIQTLSINELKVWAAKINAQWLLQAPTEQIEQQLLAFKRALNLLPSEMSYSIGLLLEQDIEQLQQYQSLFKNSEKPSVAPLRQLIAQMPEPNGDYQTEESAQKSEQGAWQALLDKLSGLIKIQKREAEQVTHVEALMLHEVIQQRLLMEVDRLDYAVQIASQPMLSRSIEQLGVIAAAQAPQIAEEVKAALLPFKKLESRQRQPLLITKIASAKQ